MKIKVLYFSSIRDRIGKVSEEIEFEGITVAELKELLSYLYPDIRESLEKVMFAVNEEYVSLDNKLKHGDTVAIIPPVSGG